MRLDPNTRRMITRLLLLAAVIVGGWYGYQYLQKNGGKLEKDFNKAQVESVDTKEAAHFRESLNNLSRDQLGAVLGPSKKTARKGSIVCEFYPRDGKPRQQYRFCFNRKSKLLIEVKAVPVS